LWKVKLQSKLFPRELPQPPGTICHFAQWLCLSQEVISPSCWGSGCSATAWLQASTAESSSLASGGSNLPSIYFSSIFWSHEDSLEPLEQEFSQWCSGQKPSPANRNHPSLLQGPGLLRSHAGASAQQGGEPTVG